MVDASNTTGENTQESSQAVLERSALSYLGSDLQRFWSQCGAQHIHPADKPFFDKDNDLEGTSIGGNERRRAQFQTDSYGPCPFDGPLDSARLIVCLANPNYSTLPVAGVQKTVMEQRTGEAPLPPVFDCYYQPRIADPLGLHIEEMRDWVSLFNLCPYASSYMEGPEMRLAAGLPSVWAAQKHFREVLLPLAERDSVLFEGFRQGFRGAVCTQDAIERRSAKASLAPASRTKLTFATLRGGVFVGCKASSGLALRLI